MDTPPSTDSPRRPRSAAPDKDELYQIDPRRRYKRRATDSLSELKDSGSENESGSSMSDSEEHELGPIGSDMDVDEETGLTGKERQKYLQRKRRRDALDSRIAGAGGISKEEARQADRSVIRKLLFNAFLIGLWYLFSLSISIVRRSFPYSLLQD
jgi:solute carrier family 35, member C2